MGKIYKNNYLNNINRKCKINIINIINIGEVKKGKAKIWN